MILGLNVVCAIAVVSARFFNLLFPPFSFSPQQVVKTCEKFGYPLTTHSKDVLFFSASSDEVWPTVVFYMPHSTIRIYAGFFEPEIHFVENMKVKSIFHLKFLLMFSNLFFNIIYNLDRSSLKP